MSQIFCKDIIIKRMYHLRLPLLFDLAWWASCPVRLQYSLINKISRRRGVVVITTTQLHSTKTEFRFCTGSYPARGVLEIRDGQDLGQWSRLEIKLCITNKTMYRHQLKTSTQFFYVWSQSSREGSTWTTTCGWMWIVVSFVQLDCRIL